MVKCGQVGLMLTSPGMSHDLKCIHRPKWSLKDLQSQEQWWFSSFQPYQVSWHIPNISKSLLQFCCSPPILHPLPSSEASLQSPPAHPAALLRSVERALRSAASWTQKMVDRKPWYILWLLVLTILKNISQWEGLSHILWKIKNVPNHQPATFSPSGFFFFGVS